MATMCYLASMIVVRPTQSLAKRMGIKLTPEPAKSETVLGDWYAQDVVFDRKQFVFCMSERGRLPILIPAAPYANFPERLSDAVGEILLALRVPKETAHQEWLAMQEFTLGKTDNRSVMGTLKQFLEIMRYADPPFNFSRYSTSEISLDLACNLGTLTLEEFHPAEAALALFGQPLPRQKASRPALYLVKPAE